MGNFNSFEEIISWKKARLFNHKIYLVTESQNFNKAFDLNYISKEISERAFYMI
jgi:hypothetical protein